MKRFLFFCFALATVAASYAQAVRVDEIESVSSLRYGKDWVKASQNLITAESITLDKNRNFSFSHKVDLPGVNIDKIYSSLNYTLVMLFNNTMSSIKYTDKDQGVVIAECYMSNIAAGAGGVDKYNLDINPVLRFDIKEGQVAIEYTLQSYIVSRNDGAPMPRFDNMKPDMTQNWPISSTFPFMPKDPFKAKKINAKAFVMSYTYSQVLLEKIEKNLKDACYKE